MSGQFWVHLLNKSQMNHRMEEYKSGCWDVRTSGFCKIHGEVKSSYILQPLKYDSLKHPLYLNSHFCTCSYYTLYYTLLLNILIELLQ